LSDKIEVKSLINLQLTGKLSLKLNSNSSLLLEYGRLNRLLIFGHYGENTNTHIFIQTVAIMEIKQLPLIICNICETLLIFSNCKNFFVCYAYSQTVPSKVSQYNKEISSFEWFN